MGNRFGGALAARPLQFIWLADCSGSMSGKKIEALNFGIREAIVPMREVAAENPNAKVLVRAIRFSNGAQWWEQRFQDPQFRRFDCAHHAGGIVYFPSFVSFGKFNSTEFPSPSTSARAFGQLAFSSRGVVAKV